MLTSVCGALAARDVALLAGATPAVLRRTPATLLGLEAAAATAATLLNARLVLDAEAGAAAGRPAGAEAVRRFTVGALLFLHTWRFWIYLQPDQGRQVT